MPELRNCRECGKLFVGTGPLCPDCVRKDAEQFERLRSHLEETPGAFIQETCEATGVSPATIRRFVAEGRLSMAADAGATCTVCGAPVVTGRLCPDCQANLEAAARRTRRPSRGGFYSRRPRG